MIKVNITLKTDDKKKAPAIMKEIAEKIALGIDMSNAEEYSFKIVDTFEEQQS